MAAQIPAGAVTRMGEKRVDAGYVLGIARAEFDFAVLLLDRVVLLDSDCAERGVIFGDSVAQDSVVAEVDDCDQQEYGEEDAIESSHRRVEGIVNRWHSIAFKAPKSTIGVSGLRMLSGNRPALDRIPSAQDN